MKPATRTPRTLTKEELTLLKKLCQPEPFAPTPLERIFLESFRKDGLVIDHSDGSVEVSNFGADCYICTVDRSPVN